MKKLSVLIVSLLCCFLVSCGSSQKTERKAESNFSLGIRAFENNDFAAAAGYLEKATKEEPANWEAQIKLGDTYVKLNQQEKARQAYTQVTQLVAKQNEGDKIAIPMLLAGGTAHLYLQDYHKAFYYFREVIKKKSGNYDANWGAGYCKFQLEMYQEAMLYFDVCRELQPENVEVNFYLARSTQKAQRGVSKQVVEMYEQSAASGPKEAALYLGDIYRHNDYKNRAVEQYQRYVAKGGILEKATAEWLEQQTVKVAEREKNNLATTAENKPAADVQPPAPVKETLKVCPKCGRLGDKNAEVCEFDGETLGQLK